VQNVHESVPLIGLSVLCKYLVGESESFCCGRLKVFWSTVDLREVSHRLFGYLLP
jgi:hypothetical protein